MIQHLLGLAFTLASFVIVLSVVVFVHEFGHFFVARRCGVRCESFSIGFGRELFGWTDRHGTRWKFSLIPLGGYVRMAGEDDMMHVIEGGNTEPEGRGAIVADPALRSTVPDARPQKVAGGTRASSLADVGGSLKDRPVWQRAAVVFAGPAVNFLFAVAVFFVIFLAFGRPMFKPVVGSVMPGSAAEEAGFTPGDRIVNIDGTEIKSFEDISQLVQIGYGAPMHVTVQRDGADVQLTVTPRIIEDTDPFGNKEKTVLLGIQSTEETGHVRRLGPVDALGASVKQTYDIVDGTLVAAGQMISGRRGTEGLGGPIKIAKYSADAAKTGPVGFVLFMAFLSINLGLINLFPVPLLDGGHLLFYAIEAVRGRPLSERTQEWGFRVGAALVGALMIFVICNDIVRS
jgi:regulator of sigma E protease